jgi:hypothetical protein
MIIMPKGNTAGGIMRHRKRLLMGIWNPERSAERIIDLHKQLHRCVDTLNAVQQGAQEADGLLEQQVIHLIEDICFSFLGKKFPYKTLDKCLKD